jgi:hypothetical protein
MKTTSFVLAVALGVPLVAQAANAPTMPGQAIGRSELPSAVDESLARESRNIGNAIGPLRLQKQPDGRDVYSANLVGKRGEVVTVDATGRVLLRKPY